MGYVRAPGDGGDVPKGPMFRANTGLVRLALRNRIEEIVIAMDERRKGFPTAELLRVPPARHPGDRHPDLPRARKRPRQRRADAPELA